MIYFTSDNHFYHSNIIKYCNRPFSDVHSMNEHLINSWNKTVTQEDDIYVLGDFSFKSTKKSSRYILHNLNGKKYFIKGNHDNTEYFNNFKNSNLIEWWKYTYDFSYEHDGNIYDFSLSHYPHYPTKNSNIICLHGHTHGRLDHHGDYLVHPNVLDVGVDSVGYEPISIVQVIDIINKKNK